MMRFAERTGIMSPSSPTRRYLWTDAFAVCNFIELRRDDLALALVDRVHHTLGKHRPDDARTGWISGLDAETGEAHPTLGGLRIGKPLAERGPSERIDERLEWERDGQYFHYLTKWMHALDQLARATSQPVFNTWAGELAEATYRTFVHGSPARMFWKMSIDLSRPQVASMGQHDPLDGFVTCLELSATAAELGAGRLNLGDATAAFASMIQPGSLATTDPLGIGGLLVDAYRLAQLVTQQRGLIDTLLAAAAIGLSRYAATADLGSRAAHRLAFRELGLAIGLEAASRIPEAAARAGIDRYLSLRDEIDGFWLQPEHRTTRTWMEHVDINDVMLVTSLLPDGFLRRHHAGGGRSSLVYSLL